MFDTARTTAGLLYSRFRYRKSQEPVVSFTNAFSAAERVLLIMPMQRREFLPTIMIIDLLKKRFREENITVVSDDHGREAVRMLVRSQFIHIHKDEITPLFLPRRQVLSRVSQKRYDIAIDLNLDLVLPSAYICKESNARVRVGFARKQSDLFYNLQIQPDPLLDRKTVYDRMANFLQMF